MGKVVGAEPLAILRAHCSSS